MRLMRLAAILCVGLVCAACSTPPSEKMRPGPGQERRDAAADTTRCRAEGQAAVASQRVAMPAEMQHVMREAVVRGCVLWLGWEIREGDLSVSRQAPKPEQAGTIGGDVHACWTHAGKELPPEQPDGIFGRCMTARGYAIGRW